MSEAIKEKLHKLIDEASEERLKEMYDWLNEEPAATIHYTPGELGMFYKRLAEHEENKGKSFGVAEGLTMIRNSKKS